MLSAFLFTVGCATDDIADSTLDDTPTARAFAERAARPVDELASACVSKAETPIVPDMTVAGPDMPGVSRRIREGGVMAHDEGEEDGAVDATELAGDVDVARFGRVMEPVRPATAVAPHAIDIDYWAALFTDPDGDCMLTYFELFAGTDASNPDTDGDGWFDGACNERRQLVLTRVYARDEQEDLGADETYFVADDVRYPTADLDDWWRFDDGDSRNVEQVIATRTRGTGSNALALVQLEAWEDDYEVWNEWTVDDLLGYTWIDLGAYDHGDTFTVRWARSDWDYELTFRVDVQPFADPTPTADGDTDGDGIAESAEYRVAHELGGIADPAHADLLVELDSMSGHPLHTNARRLVTTQYHRHGIHAHIWRHQVLANDPCLTVPEARALYHDYFTRKRYNAFRYAVIGAELWNDASGVSWADALFIDDSTWWIDGDVLAQAGTLHHEIGHGVSLRQGSATDKGPGTFRWIDSTAWFSYDSAMNYTFQPTMVDYSSDGAGGADGWDHDDWDDVDPSWALRYSFGATTSTERGHCD